MNAMNTVPVFYATSEGHTQRIAETIASTLREQGLVSEAVRLASRSPSPDWTTIISAVIGASLHGGRHQPAAAAFITREAAQLNARPSAFFSVSLSAGSRNLAEVATARDMASRFVRAAEWRPRRLACIAGKLAYTKYGFFKRWIMRRIAEREGGPTDTSRDHDLTDWNAVREFALGVAADARRCEQTQAAS
jgi:menaquinone-dependent protoporphyrinogen oxidase